ncbi:MAG: hypothetical protein K8J31_27875 [Anaerolineae bacterium]|nr:hypothetical protein [Anaerolineae bacterium]
MYSRLLAGLNGLALVFTCLMAAEAQPVEAAVIDARNVDQLAPVAQIDFSALPAEAGEILNGRVYVSADGRHLAVVNRDSQVVFLDDTGALLGVTETMLTSDGFPATFIDGAFDDMGNVFAAVHTAGGSYNITLATVGAGSETTTVISDDKPVSVWLDSEFVWLEVIPADPNQPTYLAQTTLVDVGTGQFATTRWTRRPFAPAQDREAVARIGRLPAPLAVTATQDGQVSRWNLSTGERSAMARVDAVPIYGAATPDGRYLAWRDPASTRLSVLDFETGQNRLVASLNGLYVPFLLISARADVVIGVHPNDEPVVVAWEVSTGSLHRLGPYRHCLRPPDMVRLSNNAQRLVIGCDAGLQIWQVSPA